MSNIRILQDVTVYNSITALSSITVNELTVTTNASANKVSIGGQTLGSYKLAVLGDTYLNGNLTVAGSATFHNTEYTTTSAISVTNTGTGPALVVNQTGEQAIAALYDDDNIALYVDGKAGTGGYVGVGTATPNERLTVAGNISARGTIYGTFNKFISAFGNSSDTLYEIVHGLGTEDVIVSIIDTVTKEVVYPSTVNYSVSSIKVEFSEAPGDGAFKAIVI